MELNVKSWRLNLKSSQSDNEHLITIEKDCVCNAIANPTAFIHLNIV